MITEGNWVVIVLSHGTELIVYGNTFYISEVQAKDEARKYTIETGGHAYVSFIQGVFRPSVDPVIWEYTK
jgi:hypothetical protein